jgi:hypothetical protein
MSTLTVSNISDATTTVGTSYVVNGSAKAWANFNQIGTQSIRDSFNISSITDTLTGSSSFGVSSSFSNTNAEVTGGSTYINNNWRFSPRSRLTATSTIEFQVANSAQTLADADQNSFSAHGDLA